MKKIVIIFFTLMMLTLCLAETDLVKRDRATMRKGPGSMFEIIADLAKGTEFEIIGEEMGWYDIMVEDLEGFVSVKVTQEPRIQTDIFAMMGQQQVSLEVSTHGMSAGVKGFAERFGEKFETDPDFFDIYADYQMNTDKYEDFKEETYRCGKRFTKSIQIPLYEKRDYFSFSEEGMGLAIAGKIASIGLYHNDDLNEYINQVGNIIVEVTDVYDTGFKFFILDTEKANAYACPGGIVFITRGMLEHIWNEAELACILAHEIAHVARRHGMIELEERKYHVKSDNAFDELDQEMEDIGIEYDEEAKATEEEMEKLAFEIYETIFNGRLAEYEKEADYLAMIFAARAGYDATQILSILERLVASESESTNEHYTADQLKTRVDDIRVNLDRLILPENLFDHRLRWEEMALYLRYD